jgi:hypothetical protein
MKTEQEIRIEFEAYMQANQQRPILKRRIGREKNEQGQDCYFLGGVEWKWQWWLACQQQAEARYNVLNITFEALQETHNNLQNIANMQCRRIFWMKTNIKNALSMLNLKRNDISRLIDSDKAPHSMKTLRYVADELNKALDDSWQTAT